MKKREHRRYLTEKYQRRQMFLRRKTQNKIVYDPIRKRLSKRAQKAYFIFLLKNEICYVGKRWPWYYDDITPAEKGRLRTVSFDTCGRPKCPLCSNPRRSGFRKKKDKLTKAELVSEQKFNEGLEEYEEQNNGKE